MSTALDEDIEEWLDLTSEDEDPCNACSRVAVIAMIHTITCGHAPPPLPFCLYHYDAVNKTIIRAQGTLYRNRVQCKECKATGDFIRWEPVK